MTSHPFGQPGRYFSTAVLYGGADLPERLAGGSRQPIFAGQSRGGGQLACQGIGGERDLADVGHAMSAGWTPSGKGFCGKIKQKSFFFGYCQKDGYITADFFVHALLSENKKDTRICSRVKVVSRSVCWRFSDRRLKPARKAMCSTVRSVCRSSSLWNRFSDALTFARRSSPERQLAPKWPATMPSWAYANYERGVVFPILFFRSGWLIIMRERGGLSITGALCTGAFDVAADGGPRWKGSTAFYP